MARRKQRILLLALLVAAGIGVGAVLWYRQTHEELSDRLVLYGNVDIREIQLAFNNSERITDILVKEGDPVQTGQLLATLQTDRLTPGVRQAEAEVEAQNQIVRRLTAGTRKQEIEQVKSEVEASKARAIEAELLLQRVKTASGNGAATPQELTNAEAVYQETAANLQAAHEKLSLALEGPRPEDISSAKALLRAQEARLELLRRQLKDARLYAPQEGVVRNRILEPGDMASPLRPVLTLAIMDPVWVRVYVNESDLGKIRPGMNAWVTTDSHPNKRYSASVGYISPTAEFTPKTVETPQIRTSLVYQVRVYVQNPENELRLGMPATVTLALDQPARTTTQPTVYPLTRPVDGM